MPTYRNTLAFSFLFRFWQEVAGELELGTQEQHVDHEIIEDIHRGVVSHMDLGTMTTGMSKGLEESRFHPYPA